MNKVNKKNFLSFKILLIVAVLLILFSLIAPYFTPNDPFNTDFTNILAKPSAQYPFGTDAVGRCILSRILYGIRISLGLTFTLLLITFVLGVSIGTFSAIYGGVIDNTIMRLVDTILAFPDIVFAIAIVGVIGPGTINTVLALSVIWWTHYARLTRVLINSVKNHVYIDAAVMAGASKTKLITHYMYPNIISPLLVQFTVDISGMMLALAGMSFLGLGVQPPIPELGTMLSDGKDYLQTAPWMLLYPGMFIFIIVAVFNLLGDKVRDVLDPKVN